MTAPRALGRRRRVSASRRSRPRSSRPCSRHRCALRTLHTLLALHTVLLPGIRTAFTTGPCPAGTRMYMAWIYSKRLARRSRTCSLGGGGGEVARKEGGG